MFRSRRFKFQKSDPGYILKRYLGADDPGITKLVVPTIYRFRCVTEIDSGCFTDCKYLRKVYVPDRIRYIYRDAFYNCEELREIRLPREISMEMGAFVKCPKLKPETVLAGCIGERESRVHYAMSLHGNIQWDELFRADVFPLTLKYHTFGNAGMKMLYTELIRRGLISHLKTLEDAGKNPTAEETDELIRFSVENQKPELTAYLLELKKRKFGFSDFGEGDDFEL